jgi:hypothetical protein
MLVCSLQSNFGSSTTPHVLLQARQACYECVTQAIAAFEANPALPMAGPGAAAREQAWKDTLDEALRSEDSLFLDNLFTFLESDQ